MFYIKELIFRVQYFLVSLSLTLILCYTYRSLLLYLLTFSVLSSNNDSNISGVDYFIYTHPSELLTIYFLVIFYFSGLFLLPLLLWNFLDFLKSSLLRVEYYFLLQLFSILVLMIGLSNLFCFLNLFPTFWIFFESFNNFSDKINNELNFFFRVKNSRLFLIFKQFFVPNKYLFIFFIIYLFFIQFLWYKNFITLEETFYIF